MCVSGAASASNHYLAERIQPNVCLLPACLFGSKGGKDLAKGQFFSLSLIDLHSTRAFDNFHARLEASEMWLSCKITNKFTVERIRIHA